MARFCLRELSGSVVAGAIKENSTQTICGLSSRQPDTYFFCVLLVMRLNAYTHWLFNDRPKKQLML